MSASGGNIGVKMGMNKKIDNAYLNQYADNVIKRGYEIYDLWIAQRLDSRKIVASAEAAVSLLKKRKNMLAFTNALAYIFALDTRINEKYYNIFRCLFSYFSWRREIRALKSFKIALNIPLNETDIRNVIMIEIEKLAEKLENGWDDEEDNDTHGGKINGRAEDEVAAQEKGTEETSEETLDADELIDKEESKEDSDQKEEQSIESQEESKEEIGEQKETAESQNDITDEKEKLAQKNDENQKEENNVSDDKSETNIDEKNKKEDAKSYNAAEDYPLPNVENVREESAQKTSFIDEAINDNTIKDKGDFIHHNHTEDFNADKEITRNGNDATQKSEEEKNSDKDAYLYDEMMKGKREDNTQDVDKLPQEKNETKQGAEQKNENNVLAKQDAEQKNEGSASLKQEKEDVRVPLQVDITDAEVNQVIHDINKYMSDESKEAYYNWQIEIAREQMSIDLEEGHVDKIEMSEPLQTKSFGVGINRK